MSKIFRDFYAPNYPTLVFQISYICAKTWCLYVCFFVTLGGLRAVRSTVTYFEQVLCRGLCVYFDAAYIVFSIDCPFKCTR